MTKKITEHEGKKFLRKINGLVNVGQPDQQTKTVEVDVYDVLVAFNVTCPAIAHAVKKLLCCGVRGKGDNLADLLGVEAAVARAIELERQRVHGSAYFTAEAVGRMIGKVNEAEKRATVQTVNENIT